MPDERWQRVKDLVDAALEHPVEAREAFLREACGEDAGLRREVESLVAARCEAGDFLSEPARLAEDDLPTVDAAGRLRGDATSPARLALGTRLGPYEVVSFLGVGGMGEVYKARDTRLDRTVAIKVLTADAANHPDIHRRFEREARTISRLSHPHICALYDVGQHHGSSFLVMEYLEGETLAQRLRSGPLPLDEALRYATQIAEALEEAHQNGVVHRDLKPSNVVLTKKGAKLHSTIVPAEDESTRSRTLTRAGLIVGTLRYMAPEQLERRTVDERTDIFAFGLVLYEMVSGRRAFEAPSESGLIAAILKCEPPPLSQVQPLAPRSLEALVQRCLAKEPADRWPSGGDLLAALARLGAGSRPPTWRGRRRIANIAAGLATLLLLGGAAGWLVLRRGQEHSGTNPLVPSLAVMPFVNMSGGTEDQYLSDGMAEELINVLARVQGLKVVARTSSFVFRGGGVSADEVGRRLGVSHLVEGSVRRSGRRVRISAQLVAASQGLALWSESYDRELSDVLAVQEDIARAVASMLRVRLATTTGSARRRPPDFQAYDAYLRGRAAWSRRTPEDLAQAVALFQQAIVHEPGYAEAYAGLADAFLTQGRNRNQSVRYSEALLRASGAAERALALDPDLAEGHATRGALHLERLEWEDSERAYRRAIELKPSYATPHQWYALMFYQVGRLEEGLREATRAVELDPLAVSVNGTLAIGLYLSRDLEQALARAHRARELNPDYPGPLRLLSQIEEARGRLPEALELARRAAEKGVGMAQPRAQLARMHARLGHTAQARAILGELEREPERAWPASSTSTWPWATSTAPSRGWSAAVGPPPAGLISPGSIPRTTASDRTRVSRSCSGASGCSSPRRTRGVRDDLELAPALRAPEGIGPSSTTHGDGFGAGVTCVQ